MKVYCNFSEKLNKKGLGLVYIQVVIGDYRKRISTEIYIEPKQWDSMRKRVRRHPNAENLNAKIDQMMNNIRQWETNLILRAQRPTEIGFKEFIGEIELEKPKMPTFNEFFRETLEKDKNITQSTYRDQTQTLRLLDMFGVVAMEKVSKRFILEFEQFMTEQGLRPNTRSKHHKTLKKYLRRAIEFELLKFDPHLHPYYRFKTPRQVVNKNFLLPKELEALEKTKPHNIGQRRTKDLFLFSCYTGMRYSDTQRFQKEWVNDGRLTYQPQKTEKHTGAVVVPIADLFEGKALEILARNDYKLPVQCIQIVNRNLRTLLLQAGIHKDMSFHSSRHSFLTLTAFQTGNLFKIMAWGGLRRSDVAMGYIHLAAELT